MGHYNAELLKQHFLVLKFVIKRQLKERKKKRTSKSAYNIPEKIYEVFEKRCCFFKIIMIRWKKKKRFQSVSLKLVKVVSNSRLVH